LAAPGGVLVLNRGRGWPPGLCSRPKLKGLGGWAVRRDFWASNWQGRGRPNGSSRSPICSVFFLFFDIHVIYYVYELFFKNFGYSIEYPCIHVGPAPDQTYHTFRLIIKPSTKYMANRSRLVQISCEKDDSPDRFS
jgi:hypothetical protein